MYKSLSPDPSPKGRGVITLSGLNLTTKAIHSPLFWRRVGGEAVLGEALYIIYVANLTLFADTAKQFVFFVFTLLGVKRQHLSF